MPHSMMSFCNAGFKGDYKNKLERKRFFTVPLTWDQFVAVDPCEGSNAPLLLHVPVF